MPYSFFIPALRKEQDIRNDIASILETDRAQVLKAGKQHWLRAVDGPTTRRTRQKGTASHESYAAVTRPQAITLHCVTLCFGVM